jgi:hypothetical protein
MIEVVMAAPLATPAATPALVIAAAVPTFEAALIAICCNTANLSTSVM